MGDSSLKAVDKKVLGALLVLADDEMITHAKQHEIARVMGYKSSGGAIAFALRALEYNNFIMTIEQGIYKILL